MRTIGIVGGMAWQSSAEVYKIINELVNKKLGGQHSCQCVMYSVDLDPVLILRDEDDWEKLNDIMVGIYNNASKAAEECGMPGNLVVGANVAGFLKIADAMMAQGV